MSLVRSLLIPETINNNINNNNNNVLFQDMVHITKKKKTKEK